MGRYFVECFQRAHFTSLAYTWHISLQHMRALSDFFCNFKIRKRKLGNLWVTIPDMVLQSFPWSCIVKYSCSSSKHIVSSPLTVRTGRDRFRLCVIQLRIGCTFWVGYSIDYLNPLMPGTLLSRSQHVVQLSNNCNNSCTKSKLYLQARMLIENL